MGVIYIVLPLLPDEKDAIVAWLRSLSIACPGEEGRFPSIEEIRSVLDHLNGYTTHYSTGSGHWYAEIAQTDRGNGDWAFLVVDNYSGTDADSHAFYFERGSPRLMVLLLRQLASACGPLILLPDTGNLPVIVTPELDLDLALRTWES